MADLTVYEDGMKVKVTYERDGESRSALGIFSGISYDVHRKRRNILVLKEERTEMPLYELIDPSGGWIIDEDEITNVEVLE